MQFQIFIIIFFRFKIRFKIVIFPSYLSSTIREHTQNLEKNNILHFTTVSSSNYPFKPTTTDFQVYLHIYLPPTDFATSRFKPGLSLSLSLSLLFLRQYLYCGIFPRPRPLLYPLCSFTGYLSKWVAARVKGKSRQGGVAGITIH